MRILKHVDGSVLWLLSKNQTAIDNLRKETTRRGVDSARLVFADGIELPEHLARHRLADLFLDTLPYNAHTTASDALWAPVLTQIGNAFAGRVAARLLNAIDLPELITHSREEYEALAIELALNVEKLKAIKEKLSRNRLTTPLFDTPLYTMHLEAAYEAMYQRHKTGLPPDHISGSTLEFWSKGLGAPLARSAPKPPTRSPHPRKRGAKSYRHKLLLVSTGIISSLALLGNDAFRSGSSV